MAPWVDAPAPCLYSRIVIAWGLWLVETTRE